MYGYPLQLYPLTTPYILIKQILLNKLSLPDVNMLTQSWPNFPYFLDLIRSIASILRNLVQLYFDLKIFSKILK